MSEPSGIGGILVAGHLCVDVRPEIHSNESVKDLFLPGRLIETGALTATCGGAVFNTGVSLHRLGIPTRLAGKIGSDLFGDMVLKLIANQGAALSQDIVVGDEENTSYSILINPKHEDRIILHYTGANSTFDESDITDTMFDGVRLFHFGYPPLLKCFYEDGGKKMGALLRRAKRKQLVTSLDMALAEPETEAGQVDWRGFLTCVLPDVDLFMPSFEEILFMLRRSEYFEFKKHPHNDIFSLVDGTLLSELANELLALGPSVVGIKLGEHGLYVKTTDQAVKMSNLQQHIGINERDWAGKERIAPCYSVQVKGTTGAGDATIAGFLAGLMHRESLEEAILTAVATGACSVSGMDAVSGIPEWTELKNRMGTGWEQRGLTIPLDEWAYKSETGIWYGPDNG
jgi:sugar/nucleoside kinase (ribokinase family)